MIRARSSVVVVCRISMVGSDSGGTRSAPRAVRRGFK